MDQAPPMASAAPRMSVCSNAKSKLNSPAHLIHCTPFMSSSINYIIIIINNNKALAQAKPGRKLCCFFLCLFCLVRRNFMPQFDPLNISGVRTPEIFFTFYSDCSPQPNSATYIKKNTFFFKTAQCRSVAQTLDKDSRVCWIRPDFFFFHL